MLRYRPVGVNREFMICRDPEVMLSGPSETGKTLASCWLIHRMADKYPGAQLAMVRQTQKSMAGSVLATFNKVIDGLPIRTIGGTRPERYIYPNGSTIWIGGMDNPDKVLSSERDVIYVNQAEEISLDAWEILTTRVTGRAGNMPYSQLIGDCNPAGRGHWILSRAGMTRFDTTHRDNPTLFDPDTGEITAQGKVTLGRLDRLTGSRYKRLRLGLWAAPEGIIYDIFDEEVHKVRAFDPPMDWPRIVGVDPFGDKVSAVWLALEPLGRVWNVYREYSRAFGETTQGHAENIRKLGHGESIFFYVGGGPSERQARVDFSACGVPLLKPGIVDVWQQIDRVYAMLKNGGLVIHDCCLGLLSEIGDYHRPVKDGVVQDGKIHNKNAYHLLDALRYAITGPEMPNEVERLVYVGG